MYDKDVKDKQLRFIEFLMLLITLLGIIFSVLNYQNKSVVTTIVQFVFSSILLALLLYILTLFYPLDSENISSEKKARLNLVYQAISGVFSLLFSGLFAITGILSDTYTNWLVYIFYLGLAVILWISLNSESIKSYFASRRDRQSPIRLTWNQIALGLGIMLVLAVIIFISYSVGKNSSQSGSLNTTQLTSVRYSIQATSMQTTVISSYCSTQPTFVHIGNTFSCGVFNAMILNATNTSVSLRATYNGISINKTVTNQKGYIGDTFALNFSGTVVFARVWGFFPSNQTVYFQMSTAPVVLTTTITVPSKTTVQ